MHRVGFFRFIQHFCGLSSFLLRFFVAHFPFAEYLKKTMNFQWETKATLSPNGCAHYNMHVCMYVWMCDTLCVHSKKKKKMGKLHIENVPIVIRIELNGNEIVVYSIFGISKTKRQSIFNRRITRKKNEMKRLRGENY